MSELQRAVRLRAVEGRWISDEPFPGSVEVDFLDAEGGRWTVADKAPIFVDDQCPWSADTGTPPDLVIGCHVGSAEDGRAIVRLAWNAEATTGETTFLVRRADLIDR